MLIYMYYLDVFIISCKMLHYILSSFTHLEHLILYKNTLQTLPIIIIRDPIFYCTWFLHSLPAPPLVIFLHNNLANGKELGKICDNFAASQ